MASIAIASSLAKEARGTSAMDSSRACTNRESGEDKCGNSVPSTVEGRVCSMKPIYHGHK